MANYSQAVGSWRFVAGLGASIPVGSGGGNTPDPGVAAANRQGSLARSAYDAAPVFDPNHAYVTPGGAVGYVWHGLTLQYELALSQAFRVQGEKTNPDTAYTVLLTGAHVGYFVLPMLSIGAEARYQRFVSDFAPCTKNAEVCDNLTVAGGVRAHIHSGNNWFRPGVSFTHGLRGPFADQGFEVAQLDLPVSF
jgi:hypothetical protein